MARKKAKHEKKNHRFLRWLLLGTGLAVAAYVIAQKQRPEPCVPAGGPEERVLIKDEENLSGLGQIMQCLITELLKNPAKVAGAQHPEPRPLHRADRAAGDRDHHDFLRRLHRHRARRGALPRTSSSSATSRP